MAEVDPVFEQPRSKIGWPANSSVRYEMWRVPTMIVVYNICPCSKSNARLNDVH
jgi:GTP cyclohydrolase FolE2